MTLTNDQVEEIIKNYNISGYAGCSNNISSTIDGIGTKSLLLYKCGLYRNIGWDAAAASINDFVSVGLAPKTMADYIGIGKNIDQSVFSEVLAGIHDACAEIKCDLIAGETAIMPDIYKDGAIDVICCVNSNDEIVIQTEVLPGDIILGIKTDNPHANGFTHIRNAIAKTDDLTYIPTFIKKTPIYTNLVDIVRSSKKAANVSGGGISRALRRLVSCDIEKSFNIPDWAIWVSDVMNIDPIDNFNCNIGFLILVDKDKEISFKDRINSLGFDSTVVGRGVIC